MILQSLKSCENEFLRGKTKLLITHFKNFFWSRILVFSFFLGAKHMPEDSFFSNGANLLMHVSEANNVAFCFSASERISTEAAAAQGF